MNICKYPKILAPCGCFVPTSRDRPETIFRLFDKNHWGLDRSFLVPMWGLVKPRDLMAIHGVCTPFLDKVLVHSSRTWWVTNLANPIIDSTSIAKKHKANLKKTCQHYYHPQRGTLKNDVNLNVPGQNPGVCLNK